MKPTSWIACASMAAALTSQAAVPVSCTTPVEPVERAPQPMTAYHPDHYQPVHLRQVVAEGQDASIFKLCHGNECPQLTTKALNNPKESSW